MTRFVHLWRSILLHHYFLGTKSFLLWQYQVCIAQLQALKAGGTIHGTLYAFLWRLKLHAFNYTAITYGHLNVQS